MGRDIHGMFYRNGEWNHIDFNCMRNYRWFDNISGDGIDEEFNHLIRSYNFDSIEKIEIETLKKDYYYGFVKINFGELRAWAEEYHPEKKAGWISYYDAWAYKNKNIVPENVYLNIPKEYHRDNWVFAEWEDPYDCTTWFINVCINHYNIDDNEDIIFYFDC